MATAAENMQLIPSWCTASAQLVHSVNTRVRHRVSAHIIQSERNQAALTESIERNS